ncbi:glutaredoxin [Ramaria rubella]|nr:glutaredoxin [Ramaria rubella]
MAAKELVEKAIADYKIAIFSKSWCPFCKAAKATLRALAAEEDIKIYELDQIEDGPAMQAYLLEKTGQRTVPNVFVNQEHIGGNDAVQAAKESGKLQKLIAA